ncbi:MAG TPA: PKD domain-containing protein [Bacteroidales bacterium]|nr:PKD domain-containing protein [Bacteroidales bacterium]HSA43697.1 PKD domain-containing protein [Bacteroidales bacterium]
MSKFSIFSFIFLMVCLSRTFGQISGDSVVCSGETELYSGPVIPGATYSWNVTGGTISGPSNTGSVTIHWPNAGSGSILLTVFLPNNTQQTHVFQVMVHSLPQPVITHQPYPGCPPGHGRGGGAGSPDQGGGNDCELVCKGATITYTTALNPGNTYLWTSGGAFSVTGANTNTVVVSWDNSPFGFLTVYETNQWGCTDSATICIEKVDLPVASFTHQLNVCKFSNVNFTNLSTGATSFQWYFGDGGTSTQQHPAHAYSNSGTYTITLIATNDCFCADTFQSVIQVDSFPGPEISCPSTVCAFDTATYTSAAGNCTHNWFVTGGTIIGPSNQPSVSVVWGAGQTGSLGLTVSGCGGTCSDTTWLIIPIIPANGTISGPPKVCPGECATYSLPKFSGATYSWSLNNGSCGAIQDSSCCEQITICWPATSFFCTDTLTVTFWDQFLGCGGTAQMVIRLRPELSIFGQKEGCSNGISSFFAFGGINCMWNVSPAGPAYSPGPSPSLNVNWNGLTGTYVVSAYPVNPNQVCNDSATVLVNVINPPAAPVITGDSIVCPGSVHQYCATGSGVIQWTVTGGSPSNGSGNCISVTWGNTPPFAIQAVAQMAQSPYCTSDPAVMNIILPVNPPVPAFSGSAIACANAVSNYSTPTLYPAGAAFTWTLTPSNAGTIISGQGSPAIQVEWGNNAPQTVVLSLNVVLCGQTVGAAFNIQLNPAPNPVIVQTGNLCPGSPAQLSATGGSFVAFQWSGPGGFTATGNPVSITQAGLYQVTVTDAGGCSGLTQLLVHETGSPVAAISAQNPLSYCIGASYNVTLCALGNPNYSYAWSNAATSQCITVSNQGNYQVTVTDLSNGCFAVSNLLTVSEIPCQPDTGTCIPTGSVSFTYSGCNPVSFLNTSVNASSFSWNFGDLSSSNQTNPTHTYNAAGFFLVSLYGYVPDASGTDSCLLVDTALIEIPLLPRFNYTAGCYGDSACFTDNSVFTAGNNITSWFWDFGDGNNSSLQNPCHLYATSGTFIVTLTISNGPCTTSWSDTLVVLPQPAAAFTFSNANCVNSPVFFSDQSTTNINYWNWNFGNAGTSLNQNPAQAYSLAATYPVTLIVHDINGCYDTITIPVTVNPNNLGGNITAFPDSIVCAGTPVILAAPACSGCTYLWSNGSTNDSITVTTSGFYQVQVSDQNACTYSTYIRVIVNQLPSAQIIGPTDACINDFVSLSVLYNPNWLYSWISNDTSVNGQTAPGVFLTAASPGLINFSVVLTDTVTGCTDTTAVHLFSVHPVPGSPVITPLTATTVCEGDSILLLMTHPDSTISLSWSTGEVNDTLVVTKDGCYDAIATNIYGCSSTTTFCVTVNELPELCSFYEGCFDTCAPYTIAGPAGGSSYQWLLNGIPITGADSQYYTATLSGAYSLIVTNSFGCTDTTGVLNLNLYPCPGDACVEFLIDTVYCDPATGQYAMQFHIINHTNIVLTEIHLQLLPPNLGAGYFPGAFIQTVQPGDTSATMSTVISNATAGDTLCFRTNVFTYDENNIEVLVCSSDTLCFVLPPCGNDTTCCSLDFISDSLWCVTDPTGASAYHFNIVVEGCGILDVQLVSQGNITLNSPYVLNGGQITISGIYYPTNITYLCLLFMMHDSTTYCADTIVCFDLPPCPPPVLPCEMGYNHLICAGQSSVFQQFIVFPGVTYTWQFPGGSPSSATGAGPHTITYLSPGVYPVQLSMSNQQGTVICSDSITVLAAPIATITQSGNFLVASPPGMMYQWYTYPVTQATLISGATAQTYNPSSSGIYCVVVQNSVACADTTCIDFMYEDACVAFLIDTVYCDPATGQYGMQFHIINQTNIVLTEIHLQLLPPNLGAGYFPGAFIQTVQPGDTSALMTTVISNATAGDTLCFRTNVFTYDPVGTEILVCSSDTLCFVLPPCGNDTSCCSLDFVSDSLWCVTDPTGAPAYHFNIVVEGCGTLDVQLSSPGNISLNGPFILTGGQFTLSGTYYPGSNTALCLLFIMHDSTAYCADTIVCFDLPPCPPPSLPCEWGFNHFICAGQSSVFQHFYFVPGVSYNWQFPGGTPSTAAGTGPHTVTYPNPGVYPVQLTMSNQQGSVICIDSITVYPAPVASVLQTGLSLTASPAGMSYQWYQYPVSQATLISGAVSQTYVPGVSGTFCVVVQNAAGCSDTACIDFLYNDPCEGLQALFSVSANWLTAHFTDLSTATPPLFITGWNWNFGDPASGVNNTSALQNPVHHFTATGYYTVCLVITAINEATGSFCYDTVCMEIYVKKRPKLVGTVVYLNDVLTPMPNTLVSLLSGGNVIAVDTTGPDGSWEFSPVNEGTYTLQVNTAKPWGGVNATDALIILKHFVQLSLLQGLKLQAANVDLNPVVNSIDALMVSRRFTGLMSSFLVGDWMIEHPVVNFAGDSMFRSIHALCFGDVNGSYVPPALKPSPELRLEQHGQVIAVQGAAEIELPLSFKNDVQVSAVSLVLDFPAQAMEVLDITAGTDPERLVYHVSDGQARIAWFTSENKHWPAGEAVFVLRLKLNEGTAAILTDDFLNCGNESSIAGFDAMTLHGQTIQYPGISFVGKAFEAGQNVPNPFSGNTVIPWYQPEEGHIRLTVHDILGKEIRNLHDGMLPAGTHSVVLEAAGLERGIYFYRIEYSAKHSAAKESRRISLVK